MIREIAAVLLTMKTNDGRPAAHHRNPVYIGLHVLFALIAAGPLALILNTGSLSAARYVGATAPLIFDKVARGVHPAAPEHGG